MNRKKRTLAIVVVLVLLIGFPCWLAYRQAEAQVEQARKDQALIAAIKSGKAGDDEKILKALADGASGEARDMGKPLTFFEALLHMLNQFRHDSRSPIDQLYQDEQLSVLLLLYRSPAEKSGSGYGYFIKEPDVAMVKALLDHGAKVNDRDTDKRGPLCYAAEASNADAVRLLLARGAEIEAKDISGYTPLMLASAESARVLLEHGANIEATGHDKRTPLLWAATMKHPDVVRILLEHGAKVSPKDFLGQTALDNVRNDKDPDARQIEALLRQQGAQ